MVSPNFPFSTLFSKTLDPCPCFRAIYKLPHPYGAAGRVYILVHENVTCTSLVERRSDTTQKFPFGVNATIELKNMTTVSGNTGTPVS